MDGPESKYLTLIGFFFFVGFSGWLVVFFFFLIFFYLRRTGEAGADSAAPELGRDAAAGPRTGPGNRSRPQPAGAGRFFFIHRHPSTPFFCFFFLEIHRPPFRPVFLRVLLEFSVGFRYPN